MNKFLAIIALVSTVALNSAAFAASGNPVLHGSTVNFGPLFPKCVNFHTSDGDPAWYGVDSSQPGASNAAGIIITSDISQLPIKFQTYCGVMSPDACNSSGPGTVIPICRVQWQ